MCHLVLSNNFDCISVRILQILDFDNNTEDSFAEFTSDAISVIESAADNRDIVASLICELLSSCLIMIAVFLLWFDFNLNINCTR